MRHMIILMGLLHITFAVKLFAEEYVVASTVEFYGLPDLNPGDTVILKNGIWKDAFLEFVGTGTKENPIVLKAETGGEVYFTGNSGLEIGGEYLVVDGLVYTGGAKYNGQIIAFRSSSTQHAYHCRLTNTKIINFNPANKSTEYKWVSMYGQYNRVDHCHFEGKNHAGAMLVIWLDDQPNYHQIDSNYFGPRPDLGVNGGETIRIGTSDWSMYDSYTVVEGNLFDECDGEIEIISNKSCKNVYRHNTFLNSEGTLTLRHGNECEVYGNYFFGTSNKNCGGIRIIGENHKVYNNYLQDIPGSSFRSAISITNGVPDSPLNRYFQVINAQVVNNTLVNCAHPFTIGAGADSELSLPPKNCFIANNVVVDYASVTDQIIEYDAVPENITYSNNIMYADVLGIDAPSGISEEDPELFFSDLWRPTDTSFLLAYGIDTISYLTHDIEGQQRISSNDAGCDQISAENASFGPLTKDDVGVQWSGPGILGANAYLSSIKIDGVDIEGFTYNQFSYDVMLEDTNSYIVTVEKQEQSSTVQISYPEAIPGTCKITVTAENLYDKETYLLSLSFETASRKNETEQMEHAFFLYPNPCEDYVIIENKEVAIAYIFDVSGKLMKRLDISDNRQAYSVSDLQTGSYRILFETEEYRAFKNLIVL